MENQAGNATIVEAVQAGDRTRVEILLAQHPEWVNSLTSGGLPLVLVALYYGHNDIADLFAKSGAELDIFSASALGNVSRINHLLSFDAEQVNAVSVDGFQPLGLAAFFGRTDAARVLVEKGAQVNLASHNPMRVMPLHSAVAGGHLEIARMLLEHGANPNARQSDEFTPLHGAAQNGQAEMVQLLLDSGVDRSAANAQGKSALDYARESGNSQAIRLLEK